LSGVAAQRGYQHQQRHHGQVLEQQDAQHAPAMLALELATLGHQLDDDGRAAHGQRAAQGQGGLPAHVPHAAQSCQQQQAGGEGQHGQQHLQQPQAEHMAAHGAQLGQVELQADGEHQEHHAKLAQVAHALGVLRQRQRMRANEDARRQIAHHRRQPQAAAGDHAQHGSQQVQQRQGE